MYRKSHTLSPFRAIPLSILTATSVAEHTHAQHGQRDKVPHVASLHESGSSSSAMQTPRAPTKACTLDLFPGRQFSATGIEYRAIAADFNGDGIDDLATLGQGSLFIRLTNLDGTFAEPQVVNTGIFALSFAAANLNGDSHLDIAVVYAITSSQNGGVTICLNNGEGSFAASGNYQVGKFSTHLAMGDLDGDADADIVAVNHSAPSASILFNHGDGTFAPHIEIEVGSSPNSVALNDFDNDGDLDLVIGNGGAETIALVQNDGAGDFAAPNFLKVGGAPSTVRMADFNNDGNSDLAFLSGGVKVYFGDGTGAFANPQIYPAQFPKRLIVADLEGDGDHDLAVIADECVSGGKVHCFIALYNDSFGQFEAEHVIAGIAPSDVAAGDFNNDGRPDVAVTSEELELFTVLRGGSNGRFTTCFRILVPQFPVDCAVDDLDGDYDVDLAVVKAGAFSVIKSTGFHKYGLPTNYSVGNGPLDVDLADLNGDGHMDAAVAAAVLSVFTNLGNGTFSPQFQYSIPSQAAALDIEDVDGDQDLDIAMVSWSTNQLTIFQNAGDGTFGIAQTHFTGVNPVDVAIVDMTGDGLPDVLTCNASKSISIFKNMGAGQLAPLAEFALGTTGDTAQGFAVGDLNHDGWADIAAAIYSPFSTARIAVLLNLGGGVFSPSVPYEAGSGVIDVEIADVNGDGHPDIIAGNLVSDNISVLPGLGNGTFEPALHFAAAGSIRRLCVRDMDGDGQADVVATYSEGVSILFNTRLGTLAGDVNGDGLVNVIDLLAVITTWGPCSTPCATDLNGDGQVNVADLLVLVIQWSN